MYENIKNVGLPTWSENDEILAKAVQKELGLKQNGLAKNISKKSFTKYFFRIFNKFKKCFSLASAATICLVILWSKNKPVSK